MNSKSVRRGVTQANFNNGNFAVVAVEMLAISVIAGLYFQSWVVFGGVWLSLILGMTVKYISLIFMFVMSVFWSLFCFGMAGLFTGLPGQITIAVLGFVIALGIHFSGIEHVQDIAHYD